MSLDNTVFLGHVDAEGRVRLDFPAQMRAYCQRTLANQSVDVTITPHGQRKTRLQEKGFHAMLKPWAAEGHRIDDLKRFMLAEVFGLMEVPNPITGEIVFVLREPHTSKLNRAKYSQLIERTLEVAAKNGVWLEAPNEYRERKAKEARKREAA